MKNKKFTHTAIMKGCDARTPKDFRQKILIKKTPSGKWWTSEHGRKFTALEGFETGSDWALYRIDLLSIKAIPNDG